VCNLESSRLGAPYIYHISRLRVNLLNQRGRTNLELLPEKTDVSILAQFT